MSGLFRSSVKRQRRSEPAPPPPRQRSRASSASAATSSTSSAAAAASSSAALPRKPSVPLSADQQRVVAAAVSGRSLFFTGGAGTGKSVTLMEIVRQLSAIHGPAAVVVTAPTGIAAANVGGITLHSWAGIGLGKGSALALAQKVMSSRHAMRRVSATKVLIVDEVSMLDGELLDKLSVVAQRVNSRAASEPFGGIQCILAGDFFQLPPVKRVKFCFEARCWDELVQDSTFVLKTIYRQRNGDFQKFLEQVRVAKLDDNSKRLLKRLAAAGSSARGGSGKGRGGSRGGASASASSHTTRLFSHNRDADVVNARKLAALIEAGAEQLTFDALDHCSGPSQWAHKKLNHCIAPESLTLAIGAAVICLKNIDPESGIVNGTRGTVTRFVNVCVEDVAPTAGDAQSRGLNGDVARVPVVLFRVGTVDGTYREISRTILQQSWTIESAGVVEAERKQLPLKLAWALSIHKAQGMSLDTLQVSLKSCFEAGHVYVALSRVRSLAGLSVIDFDLNRIRASPEVVRFYAQIRNRLDRPPPSPASVAAAKKEKERKAKARPIAPWTKVGKAARGGGQGWAQNAAKRKYGAAAAGGGAGGGGRRSSGGGSGGSGGGSGSGSSSRSVLHRRKAKLGSSARPRFNPPRPLRAADTNVAPPPLKPGALRTKQVTGGSRVCFKCQQRGHWPSRCPNVCT